MHTVLIVMASFILALMPKAPIESNTVKSLAISPDSRFIVSTQGATITLWDIESCSPLSVWREHQEIINSVAYSPDGQHIVSGGNDQMAVIWDIAAGKKARILPLIGNVTVVNYSPNGQFIVTGTHGGIVTVWDANTGEKLNTFIIGGKIWNAEFSSDNQQILIANGRYALMLDITTGEILYKVSNPHTLSLRYATFNPNGRLFATTGGQSALANIWDRQTGEFRGKLSWDMGDFYHLAYSPDGKLLSGIDIVVPINPEVHYNLIVQDSQKDTTVFKMLDVIPMTISAFSPNNRYFVFNRYDEIKIYDSTSWQAICGLK